MIGPHQHGFSVAVISLILSLGAAAQDVPGGAATANEFIDALRVAKSASASGRWTEAASAWERVVQINPGNEYWQELAEAHYKRGEFKQAIPAFEKVLDLGGYCFPSETSYNIARSFAALGDNEKAVAWLQDAFARGYRDLDHVKNDASFKLLHDDRRFVELVGPFDTSQMSRAQAWQRDLDLLQKELERKSYPQFVRMSHQELEAAVAKLSKSISNLSDLQATVEVMKLVAKMGNGHTEALPLTHIGICRNLADEILPLQRGAVRDRCRSEIPRLAGLPSTKLWRCKCESSHGSFGPRGF
jgi:tetratricopeptide (TPR) repeat protein